MLLGSQSEKTLLCIREQPLSRGTSQSAVRRRWLSLCTVWPSHSHNFSISTAILALRKVAGSQIRALGGLTDLGDLMLCQKRLHDSCRMSRRMVLMMLICSLGHCEYMWHDRNSLISRLHATSSLDSNIVFKRCHLVYTWYLIEILISFLHRASCSHSYVLFTFWHPFYMWHPDYILTSCSHAISCFHVVILLP
jgi:uncharacterized membrane protein YhaH (DUF805 family)